MKKCLISFMIPWLIFYCYGCTSKNLMAYEDAYTRSAIRDVYVKTSENTFVLTHDISDQAGGGNKRDSKEIFCKNWIFGEENLVLVYDFIDPVKGSSDLNIGKLRVDTLNIQKNQIEKIYDKQIDVTATVVLGVLLFTGLLVLAASSMDMRPDLDIGSEFISGH
jgi:hypothetical protein